MNMFRRYLAMFLVLCMLAGAVPMTAFAADADSTEPTVTEPAEDTSDENVETIGETETTDDTDETTGDTAGDTEETTGDTEETTGDTEETTGDSEETTAPTEETTVPVEETTEPTEDPYGIALLSDEEETTTTTSTQPFSTSDSSIHYRIPAIVTMSDGTMVAAADLRNHSWDSTDDNSNIDTVVAISTDGGSNWTSSVVNDTGWSGGTEANSGTYIDPALATDGTNIYMLVDLFPGQSSEYNSASRANSNGAATGYNGNGYLLLSKTASDTINASNFTYYLKDNAIYDANGTNQGYYVDDEFNIYNSSDKTTVLGNLFNYDNSYFHPMMTSYLYLLTGTYSNGTVTWNSRKMLNSQVKNSDETYLVDAPGAGLVTQNNHIVFPVYSATSSNKTEYASLIFSTNGGTTWERTGKVSSLSSEGELVELADGTLRYFYRHYGSNNHYLMYVDATWTGSTYTWGTPVDTGLAANSSTDIGALTYSKTEAGKQVILVSVPGGTYSQYDRTAGKIFVFTVGTDNALEHSSTYAFNTGAFGYSCMTEQKDGSIGLMYENGDSGNITYINLTAETISGLTFADHYLADANASAITAIMIPVTTSAQTVNIVGMSDGETASAVSGNEGIVTATVSGSTLTLTPVAAGNTTVTVTIASAVAAAAEDDSSSNTTALTLDVTVTEANITKTEDVRLAVGKTQTYTQTDDAGSGSTTLTEATITWAGSTVTATYPTAGIANDSAYADGVIDLNDCLYTFTASGNGYIVSGVTSDGTTVYLYPYGALNGSSTAQFPNSGTSAALTFTLNTDGTFYIYDGTGYLYFWRNGNNYFDRQSGTADACKFYLYRPIADGETSSAEIPGYIKATSVSESDYIIVAVYNSAYYVLRPSTSTDSSTGKYDHVAKVTGETATTSTSGTAVQITGVSAGTTTAVVGTTQYNITVYENMDVTINYQVDGNTVATETLTVASDAASVTLPGVVTDGTNTYKVSSTTLALTGASSYDVEVTEVDMVIVTTEDSPIVGNTGSEGVGDPIAGLVITTGTSYDLNLSDTITGDVTWGTTSDKITVDENGTVTGVTATDSGEVIYVTATVDGVTYAIPVTVLQRDNPDATSVRTLDFYNTLTYNCTAYYSYQCGELVEFPEGTQIYIEHDSSDTDIMCFYATPDDGYALTYVNGTGGTWFHKVLNSDETGYGYDSDGNGTHDDDIAYNQGDSYTYIHDQLISYVVNNSGAATVDEIHTMLGYAVAKKCDGAFFFSRAADKGNINSSCTFIAEKLPEIYKNLSKVSYIDDKGTTDTSDDERVYVNYVDGMNIGIGYTLHYTIYVGVPTMTYPTQSVEIDYTNFVVDDPLTGHKWTAAEMSSETLVDTFTWFESSEDTTGTSVTVTDYDTEDAFRHNMEAGSVESFPMASFTYTNSSGGTSTYSDSIINIYAFETSIELGANNFLSLVKDGIITNTADLSYTYHGEYSKGSSATASAAVAEVLVVVPEYVIDFGLPIEIDLTNDPLVEGDSIIAATAQYGNVTITGDSTSKRTIVYTPNTILQGADFITLTFAENGNKEAIIGYGVRIYPATSVYYEESFLLNNASNWTISSATLGNQESAELGEASESANNFGYDSVYANKGTDTGYITGGAGASTSFTFTGTGFQLYGNSNSASGYVTVYSQGSLSKLYMINTKLTDVEGNEIADTTYYSLPFISETDLPYGTYTVQIKQTNGDSAIYLDGVRILNTINDTTTGSGNIYYADQEDNPVFYELRDSVLNAIGVENVTDSAYTDTADRVGLADSVKDMAGQVYNAANGATALILDESYTLDESTAVQELLDNGPKNELYLYPNQTLVFKVTTDRVMQLGLKAPTGSATYNLNNSDSDTTLSTSVDMFYEIAGKGEASNGLTVTIENTGNNVLSVTLLKICDDPNAVFTALTQEDIETTMLAMCGLVDEDSSVESEETETPVKPSEPEEELPTEPSEPEVPEEPTEPEIEPTRPTRPSKPGHGKPGSDNPTRPTEEATNKEAEATLNIVFVNLRGKQVGTATLTETGNENSRCVFSSSEVSAQAPANYRALWFFPAIVSYGDTATIIVTVL